MKAILLDEFGGPEKLHLVDVSDPAPADHEVLVKVRATSVNPVDYKIREHGDEFGLETPAIIGYDVSGVVEAVGHAVDAFDVGDEVFYTPEIDARGSYAEYHVAAADIVAPKPPNLSHEEAAALPLAGCTAWQALVERAQIQVGDLVLIHGSGGVGALAAQMAHAAGATVYAVGSSYMQDRLGELGADLAVDYTSEDFVEIVREATDGAGVDVVLDTVGGDTLARSLEVTAPFGRMVTILEDSDGVPGAATSRNVEVHYLMMQRDGGTMRALHGLAATGALRPLVADVLPLERTGEAHRRLQEGGVPGKLVLTPQ